MAMNMAGSAGGGGGRRGRRRAAVMAEINVTPMVDVMLVLLIIFMVAAPLMVQGVPLDLPRTSATKLAKVRKPMVVSLAPDGALYIRDERVERNNLVNRLMALRRDEGDSVVYVRADRKIPYGDVMEVMNALRTAGYLKVALVAQEPEPEPHAKRSKYPPLERVHEVPNVETRFAVGINTVECDRPLPNPGDHHDDNQGGTKQVPRDPAAGHGISEHGSTVRHPQNSVFLTVISVVRSTHF